MAHVPKPEYARFIVEHRSGLGYVVVSPEGKVVATPTLSRLMAQQQCEAKQRAADAAKKKGARACMCCGNSFKSAGIHNRLCDRCRKPSDVLGEPHRPYVERRA